ncbi:Regulatory protein RecX [termite gut metagenome]|uniref:Regulatory protein RecX n=1 Tax=termite gut metagenome TaxID=433724 RepID=A0A5J4R9F7_9ZZZZ
MTENEALSRMAAYCSKAEHCRVEIRNKLVQNEELHEEAIERILNRLENENFINNERYTRSFINDKLRFSKWGKIKIQQALSLKQIPSEMVRKQLNEIDEKEYLFILNHLLEVKKKTIFAKNQYECKSKLIRYAMGKGFELEDIKQCII